MPSRRKFNIADCQHQYLYDIYNKHLFYLCCFYVYKLQLIFVITILVCGLKVSL